MRVEDCWSSRFSLPVRDKLKLELQREFSSKDFADDLESARNQLQLAMLERLFHLSESQTTARTELLAGALVLYFIFLRSNLG
jgi:hypothetical protein